jgi:ribokinase
MGTIVVVGSSNVDLTAYCERFPGDGETRPGTAFVQGFGGKGSNQAVMMARLGAAVTFVGRVGDDALGIEVLTNLRGNGIDTSHVRLTAGTSTGVAPIWVDERGVNRILVVPGANGRLTPADVTEAVAAISEATVVVAQLETPQDATRAAFEWARGVGAVTVLNPAPAAPLVPGLAEVVDWLIPNESEFAALFGAAPTPDAVLTAAASCRGRLIVTVGERGALVVEDGRLVEVAAPVAHAVDTTGAGDAFVGGFSVGLARGWDGVRAARYGCVCGALSVRAPGAQASFPTAADVEAGYTSS